jgi:putative ABC transport system substrate-binding protein
MNRRDTLLAMLSVGAAPQAAKSQTPPVQTRIGYLGTSSPSLEPQYVEAFRQRLRELGEGREVAIDYRWAEGHDERLPALAMELARLRPAVIVTIGTPGTLAAKQATRTIPIVMASSADPVRSGLVESLARPGGNVTGFTILGAELEGKRLELLRQAVPKLSRVAVLWNTANPGVTAYYEAMQRVGRVLHIALEPVLEVRRADEFEKAFSVIAASRPDALAVIADRFLMAHRAQIVDFAAGRGLPAMYPYREYVDSGGLMSYAPSTIELMRGAATYVDRILKGATPSELPIQEPTRYELVLNLKTAGRLGLVLPQSLLLRADETLV